MNTDRFVNLLIGVALMLTAAFTARQAVVTASTIQAGSAAASQSNKLECPISGTELASIRAVYLPEAGGWWPRSDAGFVGYEGGLLTVLDC